MLNNTFFILQHSCQQDDVYQHIHIHPESYLVKIPVDTYSLEEVISHYSQMGIRLVLLVSLVSRMLLY